MTTTVEYRVNKVERFIVTRYQSGDDGSAGVEQRGEYPNEHQATLVASALAQSECVSYPIPGTSPADKVICRDDPAPWEWRRGEGKCALTA